MRDNETNNSKFRLIQIEPFDARGLKRCNPPGVGVKVGVTPKADSYFWRDRSGKVVIRWSSQGYVYHFEAARNDGEEISDLDMDELGTFIANLMHGWVIEGVDDLPNLYYDQEVEF